MIAATATCAAAATEASAQSQQPLVLNEQLQLGDVVAGQRLNVYDAAQQVTVTNAAVGVSLAGGTQGQDALVVSTQEMRGDARGQVTLTLGGDTEGAVYSVNQARGTYLGATAQDAAIAVDAAQRTSGQVRATTDIGEADARLLGGASVATGAIGNTVAVGGEQTVIRMGLDQRATASVRASTFVASQYIPAEAEFSSQALANAAETSGVSASSQQLGIRQRSSGALIEAATSANSGNAWDLAGRANAGANQIVASNRGGAMIVETDQGNSSNVRAATVVTSYTYGVATGYARAAANETLAGNNDRYVEIDNTQVNSGGVEASARFAGTKGYDVYLGADAVGNTVTGYACSSCSAYMDATNSQTNNGDVTATVSGTVAGQGRAVIGSTTATGNSATFYVSRPGG